jgi:hypothetical protein
MNTYPEKVTHEHGMTRTGSVLIRVFYGLKKRCFPVLFRGKKPVFFRVFPWLKDPVFFRGSAAARRDRVKLLGWCVGRERSGKSLKG